ncbi:MAG: hypothetical protein RL497_1813 [Pseudomonadota bacterium]|jgi:hypothetical protein
MKRHQIVAKLIRWSVPFLNIFRNPEAWPYSLEALERMDKESLGWALFDFLNSRGLGYLPKYEIHDSYHALVGYGTTVTDELKLQAFMWGNKNATFAGKTLFIIGYIVFPGKHKMLQKEISRGKKAMPLSSVDISKMMHKNLTSLRKDLCID